MIQPLALSSSTQNPEKLNQAGFKSPPPELSFQFTYSSMITGRRVALPVQSCKRIEIRGHTRVYFADIRMLFKV